MYDIIKKTIYILDYISEKSGGFISWLNIALVLIISTDVFIRYILGLSFIWITELEIYLFAFVFLFSSGYTLKHNKHVRVDVFYSKLNKKNKALIDLFGWVLFLLPWSIVVFYTSFNYALTSYSINESSPQPGGLPALYILKFSIPLGFLMLFIQGLSDMLNNVCTLLGKK